MDARKQVMEVAKSWLGLDFKPGRSEQCAAFVRAVYGEAGIPLGVARTPRDWDLTSSLAQGPQFANSFFSDEVGEAVPWEQAREGDLLAFRDTYEGDFPAGCITHVGIYGGEGHMIDRSTSSEPVRRIPVQGFWRERLVEVLRPRALLTGCSSPE